MKLTFRFLFPALIACLVAAPMAWGQADTKEKAAEEKQEKKQEEKEEQELPNAELADDATLEDAANLIDELKSFRPGDRETAMKFSRMMRTKMPALYGKIVELAEKEKATDKPIYMEAKRFVINSKSVPKLRNPKTAEEGVEDVLSFLKGLDKIGPQDARLAVMSSYYLSMANVEDDVKNKSFKKFAAVLKDSGNEGVEQSMKMVEGIHRRNNIIGSEIQLTGTTYDGDKFDLKDLRGKVVLVDFWATWCGPCIREHPNIEKNFEKYHEKGFEVVGVSIDRNRKALDNFIEKHPAKWTVLHDEGGKNEATTMYGVVGIPSMFLLDKEGKVISTTARGPRLTKLLAEIFGDEEGDGEEDDKDGDK